MRFASGESEAKNRKAPTQKRGQSPNENNHRIDLHKEAVEKPLHPYQSMQTNELFVFFSVRRLHGFRQVVPHVGDMLHMRQIN